MKELIAIGGRLRNRVCLRVSLPDEEDWPDGFNGRMIFHQPGGVTTVIDLYAKDAQQQLQDLFFPEPPTYNYENVPLMCEQHEAIDRQLNPPPSVPHTIGKPTASKQKHSQRRGFTSRKRF